VITDDGRSSAPTAILPMVNDHQQPNQVPDPHGLRVTLVR